MLTLLPLLFTPTAFAVESADLPLFHRQIYVEHVSEPMHWFAADFFDVERAGCRIGIPVNEMHADEAAIGCYFPAGRGDNERPDSPDLARAWKQARKLVKQRNSRASDLRLRYVGTWQEVVVRDIVPIPAGDNPHTDRLYDHGRAQYAVAKQGIERASFLGMSTFGGIGLAGPIDSADVHFLDVELPTELAGTSVLRHSWNPEADPTYHDAEQAIREAALAALPAYEAGERNAPKLDVAQTLPDGLNRAIGGAVSIYGRFRHELHAQPRKEGLPTEDVRAFFEFHAPLTTAREAALRFERQVPKLGLTLVYELDLPANTAALTATDSTGRQVRAAWSVDLELVEDGHKLWPEVVRSKLTDKDADVVHQATELREDQLQLAVPTSLEADYRVIDIYAAAVHAAAGPWLGEPTWTVIEPDTFSE